ncbi:MAG: hypothetical protein E7534_02185 [Ruminococcaceae bacterium]|nr:hypothetical protein [Oscillospiraceae bacterium]
MTNRATTTTMSTVPVAGAKTTAPKTSAAGATISATPVAAGATADERWEMTDFEIGRAYRLAKDPEMMIDILADLNAVSRRKMRRKMVALGLIPAKRQGAKSGSHWSAEEDKLLERAMEEGCSFAAAAARLAGRSVKSVRNRWERLQAEFLSARKAAGL